MKRLFVLLSSLLLLTGCNPNGDFTTWDITNKDVKKYSENLSTLKKNEKQYKSKLYILPSKDTLDKAEEIITYRYGKHDNLFEATYVLYVVARYNASTFASESSRLFNIKAGFSNGKTKEVIRYSTSIMTYVATWEYGDYVEYAKEYSDTYTIAYVFNYGYSWEKSGLESKYQLTSLTLPSEHKDFDNFYTIYVYYSNGNELYTND